MLGRQRVAWLKLRKCTNIDTAPFATFSRGLRPIIGTPGYRMSMPSKSSTVWSSQRMLIGLIVLPSVPFLKDRHRRIRIGKRNGWTLREILILNAAHLLWDMGSWCSLSSLPGVSHFRSWCFGEHIVSWSWFYYLCCKVANYSMGSLQCHRWYHR